MVKFYGCILILFLFSSYSFAQIYINESFDSLPPTWTVTDAGSVNGDSWVTGFQGGSNSLNGSSCAFVDSDLNGNGPHLIETLTSPVFDATFAGLLYLDFQQYFRWSALDTAYVDVFDGIAWVNVLTLAGSNTGAFNNPDFQHIDITSFKNPNMQVRFHYNDGNSWAWYWLIDNVIIYNQTCPAPSDLNALAVDTFAFVTWTENGNASEWELEYGPVGFAQGSGTFQLSPSTADTIFNLQNDTNYDVYVRSICGVGDTSFWFGPFNFFTPCGEKLAPWSDDVESHVTALGFDRSECWTTQFNSTYNWNITDNGATPTLNTGPLAANSDFQFFYTESTTAGINDTAVLLSPFIQLDSINFPILEFYYHMYGQQIGTLIVDIHDGNSWVNLDSIVGQQQQVQSEPFFLKQLSLDTLSGIVQVRFTAISNGSFNGDICIDDVSIFEGSSCQSPINITVSNIQSNAITINWEDVSPTGSWLIEYGPSGFQQDSGTTIVINSNPFVLNGLLANTSYDFYFSAVCTNGDTSLWSNDISFTTNLACPAPSDLSAYALSDTTAYLNWIENGTANSWLIEYGPIGFIPNSGIFIQSNILPFILDSLLPFSGYEFYISSLCGGDTSASVGPQDFHTLRDSLNCPASIASVFLREDFELGFPVGWSNTSVIDPIWRINTGQTSSLGTGPDEAFSGLNYIYLETSSGDEDDTDTLKLPFVDLSNFTSSARMMFNYHMYGINMGSLMVEISSDSGQTFNTALVIDGQQQDALDDDWIIANVDLSAYLGKRILVNFIGVRGGNFMGDIALDLIEFEACAVCPAPDSLHVVTVTDSSAQISFNEIGSAGQWLLEYGPSGFDLGTGLDTLIDSLPFVIDSLLSSTTYDIYIRSNCDSSDTSIWVGPLIITTALPSLACNNDTTLFEERFEGNISWINTSSSNPMWMLGNGQTPSTGTGPLTAYEGQNYYYFETSGGTLGFKDTLNSPPIDLCQHNGTARLSFFYHMFGDDMGSLSLEISKNGGLSYDQIFYRNGQQQTDVSDPWIQAVLDISAYSGKGIKLRFIGTRGPGFTGDIAIDYLRIDACPGGSSYADVQVNEILGLDPVACNLNMLNGWIVLQNLSTDTLFDVPVAILNNGFIVGGNVLNELFPGATDTIISPSLPTQNGNYSLSVQSTYSCDIDTTNNEVLFNYIASNPSGTITQNASVFCYNDNTGALTVNPSGALGNNYSFTWSDNAGNSNNNTVQNLSAGDYYVIVSDALNCSDTVFYSIPAISGINFNETIINNPCNGDSEAAIYLNMVLNDSLYQFEWDNGDSLPYLENLSEGDYNITITNNDNCVEFFTIQITDPTILVANIINNGGGMATVEPFGGTAPFTFLWDANANNQTDSIATGLTNGQLVQVTITDNNGCTATDTLTVSLISVNMIKNDVYINLYPNPNTGQATLDLLFSEIDHWKLNIFNTIGQLVEIRDLGRFKEQSISMNFSGLQSGIYYLIIYSEDKFYKINMILNKNE